MQALVFRLAPGLVGRADKLAAAKNLALCRQRQHAVMPERLIEVAFRQLRPRLTEFRKVAVQHFRPGEYAAHRAMRQIRFVFVFKRFAIITRRVVARALRSAMPEHNRGAVRQRRLPDQPRQGIAQRAEIGLL